jgi:hypothetical protein
MIVHLTHQIDKVGLKTHVIFPASKTFSFKLNNLILKASTVPMRLVRMSVSGDFIEVEKLASVQHQTASIADKFAAPGATALIAPLYRLLELIS